MRNSTARRAASVALALLLLAPLAPAALAQSRRVPPQAPQKKNQRPGQTPETKPGEQPQEPVPQDIVPGPEETVKVATNIVNVEAVVINKRTKQIVPGLKQSNFAIFEDGLQRDITNFSTPDAPITVSVVLEFSKLGSFFGWAGSGGREPGRYEVLRPLAAFISQVVRPPDDYVSVIAYDMRPTPLTDFTNDPARLNQVLTLLLRSRPASSEANLFDALKLTLVGGRADSVVLENREERTTEYGGMASLGGQRRKAVFLISSGIDTFSKINYDDARKIAQNAGVPIYIIGTSELFFKKYGDRMPAEDGLLGATQPGRMTMLQARNALRTFAEETGGFYIPVTFEGEIPSALHTINVLMRNQYSLAYSPGAARDPKAKRRKIVVKVDVDGDGNYDEKDYEVRARQYYNPPKGAEQKAENEKK
ncbi:MAG TPA: VWA domain-containing protein [Pyrinomonadaceae bacterium]|nr:VWA domain-containing protein [Pyrinomonadaceae bacterium]